MVQRSRIHSRGLLARAMDRLRGQDQLLIRAGDELPLVVASYPRGRDIFAASLQSALSGTFPAFSDQVRGAYRDVLERVPSLVVAVLRSRNACGCLGHHHLPGTEGRLSRRLMADTGQRGAEIDLAIDAIRDWEPLPLSDFAVAAPIEILKNESAELEYHRFHTALLSVFLHELDHLAFPKRGEKEIRTRSNEFYVGAMRDFVSQHFGIAYGI